MKRKKRKAIKKKITTRSTTTLMVAHVLPVAYANSSTVEPSFNQIVQVSKTHDYQERSKTQTEIKSGDNLNTIIRKTQTDQING